MIAGRPIGAGTGKVHEGSRGSGCDLLSLELHQCRGKLLIPARDFPPNAIAAVSRLNRVTFQKDHGRGAERSRKRALEAQALAKPVHLDPVAAGSRA